MPLLMMSAALLICCPSTITCALGFLTPFCRLPNNCCQLNLLAVSCCLCCHRPNARVVSPLLHVLAITCAVASYCLYCGLLYSCSANLLIPVISSFCTWAASFPMPVLPPFRLVLSVSRHFACALSLLIPRPLAWSVSVLICTCAVRTPEKRAPANPQVRTSWPVR